MQSVCKSQSPVHSSYIPVPKLLVITCKSLSSLIVGEYVGAVVVGVVPVNPASADAAQNLEDGLMNSPLQHSLSQLAALPHPAPFDKQSEQLPWPDEDQRHCVLGVHVSWLVKEEQGVDVGEPVGDPVGADDGACVGAFEGCDGCETNQM